MQSTCSHPCQKGYVAEAIQKYYKHEQQANAKEFHTESYTAANLEKNISFHGLSENSRFSLAVYALKHFDSTQNNIYRTPNGMKSYKELNKHKSYNFPVDSQG